MEEQEAISVVSYIGCSVSLICLLIAIIALLLYRLANVKNEIIVSLYYHQGYCNYNAPATITNLKIIQKQFLSFKTLIDHNYNYVLNVQSQSGDVIL